jgi:NAD(P)-dependent dehydrogenase (short-subunit alcohol dehydrogenase family)
VIAKRLAELGANLCIPSQSSRAEDPLRHAIGIERKKLVLGTADLKNGVEAEGFVRKVVEAFGRIDVLINAAGGYSGGKRIEDLSASDIYEMFELNALSTFNMCSKVIPVMKRFGYGRIVNVSAMTAVHPQGGAGAYAISKRAVITLTETIAVENKKAGITANAVAPGIILTEANKAAMPDADHRKWVTPEQVSDVILFLASENSSAVSGSVIVIP